MEFTDWFNLSRGMFVIILFVYTDTFYHCLSTWGIIPYHDIFPIGKYNMFPMVSWKQLHIFI